MMVAGGVMGRLVGGRWKGRWGWTRANHFHRASPAVHSHLCRSLLPLLLRLRLLLRERAIVPPLIERCWTYINTIYVCYL